MSSELLFSDYFGIKPNVLEKYGALDICLEADLPLFIDPFLLFSSKKKSYQRIHAQIVAHLVRLKEHAVAHGAASNHALFRFAEVPQNWLGDCKWGNSGRGLGPKFARDVVKAFNGFYSNFGDEKLTATSHIEKLTLVGSGIGRDFISDFTTNLMLEHLLEYTQKFAQNNLAEHQIKRFSVRCVFDSQNMIWMPKQFDLPFFYKKGRPSDFIILTPLDILTKDDAFISHRDLLGRFNGIAGTLDNESLRDSVNMFFQKNLPTRPKRADIDAAIGATIRRFPEMLDYYIRDRELNREDASEVSQVKVGKIKEELISTLRSFYALVSEGSDFFAIAPNSYDNALKRVHFLKEVIEQNDGYRIFYKAGRAIASEDTIQRIFRLTWFASPLDVNSEVNNGRGPADYKISFGDRDSCIVEFKLGSSTSLTRNLENQTAIYKKASRSPTDIKVVLCYTQAEIAKVARILKRIKQEGAENIVVIDARKRVSASKV